MLLLLLFFTLNSQALVTSNSVASPKYDPFKIKPKDVEKITGKKLTFFQKIKLKLAQKLLKKYSDGEVTAKKKQARLSMLLGILGIAFLFISLSPLFGFLGILAIPSAILAVIIFGSQSLRGNSNAEGMIGVITGGVTIALIIITIIVVAIAFSGFTFE